MLIFIYTTPIYSVSYICFNFCSFSYSYFRFFPRQERDERHCGCSTEATRRPQRMHWVGTYVCVLISCFISLPSKCVREKVFFKERELQCISYVVHKKCPGQFVAIELIITTQSTNLFRFILNAVLISHHILFRAKYLSSTPFQATRLSTAGKQKESSKELPLDFNMPTPL